MARILKELPPDGRSKYDWDRWLNGKVWELQRGKDFQVAPKSFHNATAAAVRRRDLSLSSRVRGDTVVIQARKRGTK